MGQGPKIKPSKRGRIDLDDKIMAGTTRVALLIHRSIDLHKSVMMILPRTAEKMWHTWLVLIMFRSNKIIIRSSGSRKDGLQFIRFRVSSLSEKV